jgi:hypothetical protein
MFGIETLSGNAYSVALVGLVLVEAIVLYVGYGALTSLLEEAVVDKIVGE